MKRFNKDWILYFSIAVIAIILGVCLLCSQDMIDGAKKIIYYVIGVLIFLYDSLFLLPKIWRKHQNVVFGFMIAELVLVALVAISMIARDAFASLSISQAIGACFYCRGVVEIVRGYYSVGDVHVTGKNSPLDRSAKYFSILFITLGTILFYDSGLITDDKCVAVAASLFIILAVVCIYLGISHLSIEKATKTTNNSAKPKTNKKAEAKKEEPKKTEAKKAEPKKETPIIEEPKE